MTRKRKDDVGIGERGPMMGLPLVALAGLMLDPKNAREHSERNIKAIADSVARFGQRRPIVVRRKDRRVIAGNGLVVALQSIGRSHGEVLFVDDTDAEAAAFGLADNRTAELAAWNLDNLLEQLDLGGELVPGWTEDEIAALRDAAGGDGPPKAGFPDLDGRKAAHKAKPVAFFVMPDVVPKLQAAIEVAYTNGATSAMEAIRMISDSYIGGSGRG